MTLNEKIMFIGLVVTFLTTVVGWIFVARSQHNSQESITKLQEKFAMDREVRQYTLPNKMEVLNDMIEWFNQGNQLDFDARKLLAPLSPLDTAQDYENNKQTLRLSFGTWQKLQLQYIAMAEQYDPMGKQGNLPRLVTAFGWTIALSVQSVIIIDVYLDQPSEYDVKKLYDAGLAEIEIVKHNLVATTESDKSP